MKAYSPLMFAIIVIVSFFFFIGYLAGLSAGRTECLGMIKDFRAIMKEAPK